MNKTRCIYGLALVASMALIGMPGCAKKSVQSGGDSQSTQGTTKGGGVGSYPDTSVQPSGGGLRGLDKNPSEERLGSGTLLAKVFHHILHLHIRCYQEKMLLHLYAD